MYGQIRCICTVLANPTCMPVQFGPGFRSQFLAHSSESSHGNVGTGVFWKLLNGCNVVDTFCRSLNAVLTFRSQCLSHSPESSHAYNVF
jgi:hypothetical protein